MWLKSSDSRSITSETLPWFKFGNLLFKVILSGMPKKLPAPLLFLDLFQDVSDIIVSTFAVRLGPCDVTHSLSTDEFECESLSGREKCLIFVPMQKNAHQLQMCPGTEPKRSITEEWSLGHRLSSCTCPQQSIIQALYCALCDFTVKTCIETDLNCVRKLVVMRAEISATTKPVQQNLSRGEESDCWNAS